MGSGPAEVGEACLLPRILLDTHVVVRWLIDARRLSREQSRVLEGVVRRSEPVALSAISLLEIAILKSEGKLRLQVTLDEFLDEMQANEVFQIFPLSYQVASDVA